MNYHCRIRSIAVFCALAALISTAASAAVVKLDLAGNSAVSDSSVLNARVIKVVGDQVCLHVSSTGPQPQKFILKISGLKPGEQDLYINGIYKAKKTESEFVQGVKCAVPGRSLDPALSRCVESVRDRINAAIQRFDGIDEDEYVRVVHTLRQAAESVRFATMKDQYARSVDLMIAPAGAVLQVKPTSRVSNAAEAAQACTEACDMLQLARDTMYDVITSSTNGDLRNEAVAAMTPVDLKLSYYLVNGKPKGTALLINNCDLPITGNIAITAPAGWTVKANKTAFSALASGKSFNADFSLTPTKPGDVVPKSMSAHAAMTISLNAWMAKLTLDASASLPEALAPAVQAAPISAPSGAPTKG